MLNRNFILNTDSYKMSQWVQYPPNTEYVYSYIESRGGEYDKLVFFGLQAFLREYMEGPIITTKMIDEAEKIIKAHGEPFNREGWEYIVKEHKGMLPLQIKSVDEGTILPLKNVLVTVVNTDPKCYWLTSYAETALLRAIWYPTTVATNSYASKQVILAHLRNSGDPALIDFKLHDFGARGVSSFESATLGGMAHLVNFMGTDTVSGLLGAMNYYDAETPGFSIPAMEHSTVTSWGRENEVESYRNMLRNYAKPGTLLAAVSDSYDIYEACRMWGTTLKQEIIDSGAIVVIRPDSGEPASVCTEVARILDKHFGSIVNAKGYKVLNNVRIIQGDGITTEMIRRILFSLETAGFSADNIAFGQGGALLQQVNRDTLEFAMKCSAIKVAGEEAWRDVYKQPVDMPSKNSKRGLMSLVKDADGWKTVPFNERLVDRLQYRFINGTLINETTFAEVRARAKEDV